MARWAGNGAHINRLDGFRGRGRWLTTIDVGRMTDASSPPFCRRCRRFKDDSNVGKCVDARALEGDGRGREGVWGVGLVCVGGVAGPRARSLPRSHIPRTGTL
jgi:hypothetical protein